MTATHRHWFGCAETDQHAATRRLGVLTPIGVTQELAGHHRVLFRIDAGPLRDVSTCDLRNAIGPSFDQRLVQLGGEWVNGTDVIDLYQAAMAGLRGELPRVCVHHRDTTLGPDWSCAACITEQTEGQE